MAKPLSVESWFLTGPTASGKTSVGLELAARLGAEIVSLDSMAVYRGMDIGTAKPTPPQQAVVPHHLIDIRDPDQDFSLNNYLALAEHAATEIRTRGRHVLFVGGTPLYLKGLLRGVFEGPSADWSLRRRLVDEADRLGPEHLHRRLAAVDPDAAAKLHPNDTRRLIRAIEVYELIGTPITRLQQQFAVGRPAAECRVFVLDWPRETLHRRIDARVEAMFAEGLVDEVRRLLDRPHPLSRTALQAVGYREVVDHLRGKQDLAATVALVRQHTRQLAKRQMTWFRSLSECRMLPMVEPLDPVALAEQILASPPP